jgi:hypothetical protein
MSYYVDAARMSLEHLRKRLESTDLIPSHQPLLDGMPKKFATLGAAGIKSVAVLRARLKNTKSLAVVAADSGISPEYLRLLRRVVEGFFPKPQQLSVFDWLEKEVIAKLKEAGIANTRQLYEVANAELSTLAKTSGVSKKSLSECVALADLSRVQWVSPTFARVLVTAGFASATEVAKAEPNALYAAVVGANEGARFYKGKIGLRDIKRLISASRHVP